MHDVILTMISLEKFRLFGSCVIMMTCLTLPNNHSDSASAIAIRILNLIIGKFFVFHGLLLLSFMSNTDIANVDFAQALNYRIFWHLRIWQDNN